MNRIPKMARFQPLSQPHKFTTSTQPCIQNHDTIHLAPPNSSNPLQPKGPPETILPTLTEERVQLWNWRKKLQLFLGTDRLNGWPFRLGIQGQQGQQAMMKWWENSRWLMRFFGFNHGRNKYHFQKKTGKNTSNKTPNCLVFVFWFDQTTKEDRPNSILLRLAFPSKKKRHCPPNFACHVGSHHLV